MELGKAKYGSGKHVFKIQDGDNVFRIFPAMGKLAKSGKWNMYYRVEWGYKNSEGRNRPFQDVRKVNFKTQMVEVESAAHLRREALKARKTELVAILKADPKNAQALQEAKEVTEDIKRYNLDAKYYLNAIDLNGKIGLLKIGSRAFKALKAEIEKLRKQGVDPLSVEDGRFFNFNRSNESGNFQDTAYQVTVYKENVQVGNETYQKDKKHVIDQAIIDRLDDEAYELSGMYPEVTAAQVERMVNEGAPAVDEILGSGDNQAPDDEGEGQEESSGDQSTSTQSAATSTASSAKTETKTEVKAETKTEAKITKEDVAAAGAAKQTTSTTKKADTEQSNDEFLKSIGAIS